MQKMGADKHQICAEIRAAMDDRFVKEHYKLQLTTLQIIQELDSPIAMPSIRLHTRHICGGAREGLYQNKKTYNIPVLEHINNSTLPSTRDFVFVEELSMLWYLNALCEDGSGSAVPVRGVLDNPKQRLTSAWAECAVQSSSTSLSRKRRSDGERTMSSVFKRSVEEPAAVPDSPAVVWRAMWCEGAVLKALFHLLLKEIVFDGSVPLAWTRPFQRKPADIDYLEIDSCPVPASSFYSNRREALLNRFGAIAAYSSLELSNEIKSIYAISAQHPTYKVICCRGYSDEELTTFSLAVGSVALSRMLHRMAQYPSEHFRGMPDLFFWRTAVDMPLSPTELKLGRGYAFAVEVKSENDILSKWQLLWIKLLEDIGIHVEIAKVAD
jgi:hypothetical protein